MTVVVAVCGAGCVWRVRVFGSVRRSYRTISIPFAMRARCGVIIFVTVLSCNGVRNKRSCDGVGVLASARIEERICFCVRLHGAVSHESRSQI